ncbi:transketolase [Saccharomonospora iraqiensis]|uniref:transketolase n=1 Tax=Saccharomonospora iraqiensis TaxID=52698 RepID=UPI0002EF65C0|nr:transketolase [Saccharomonospora iraqiensis]
MEATSFRHPTAPHETETANERASSHDGVPHAARDLALRHRIRLDILDQSHRAGFGHIGSALSVADILAVLYGGVLRGTGADRERFILSKGHAVLALYAALYETGRIDRETLETYCGDGSVLGAHPEHSLDEIDFSTGSLGQGLSYGAGSALAARMRGSSRRTFVLLSDAELNEGAVWESVMFAAHRRLGSLVALVDVNGQQAFGHTREVLDLEPLAARWEAFGWSVHEVDGHDVDALRTVLNSLDPGSARPHVLLARTIAGSGVSFMEDRVSWRYWPLSDEQYATAAAEVTAAANDVPTPTETR